MTDVVVLELGLEGANYLDTEFYGPLFHDCCFQAYGGGLAMGHGNAGDPAFGYGVWDWAHRRADTSEYTRLGLGEGSEGYGLLDNKFYTEPGRHGDVIDCPF